MPATHTPTFHTASARIREALPDSQASVVIEALDDVVSAGVNNIGAKCAYVRGLIDALALVGTIHRDDASELSDLAWAIKREREGTWSR